MSVTHATYVIERRYRATRGRVFAAWADPATKARWLSGPDEWSRGAHELDFRVGGREVSKVTPPAGPESTFTAHFLDIVDGERIVYSYEMRLGDTRISVSLATVLIEPDGDGSRLTYTEQCGSFCRQRRPGGAQARHGPAARQPRTGDRHMILASMATSIDGLKGRPRPRARLAELRR